VKVGMIGAGAEAKEVQLPTFSSMEEVELVAIVDIDEKTAKSAAKKNNIPKVYTEYHDLLNNKNIDIVSICVPFYLHKQMAVDCAQAGKHILIEKPMAVTVQDADEIIKAVKENDVKLCIVQNYRLFPSVIESKDRIDNGRIGEIISMHAHMLDFPPLGAGSSDRQGGVIEDIGPHLIDIVLYLTDCKKMKQIYATGGNIGGNLDVIDHAQIMIEFENGALATLDLSWMTGTKEIALYVQGTGGLLHCDIRNNHVQEIHQYTTPLNDISDTIKKVSKIVKGAISGDYFIGSKQYFLKIVADFIESIENDTKPPMSVEEGRNVALVIDSAFKSIKEQRPLYGLRGNVRLLEVIEKSDKTVDR
jgi:UDP-N-acetylglucosamine 3-dehydrogenase